MSEQATLSQTARRAMIDSQLRTCGVNEPWVLAAMASLPREHFVPAAARDAAYIDRAIPLDDGHFLAAPLVHARMLAEGAPDKATRALVVTAGSTYLAELLRPLVASLDAVPVGSAPQGSGYDLILVDGAAEVLDDALVAALAEGGRIVTGLAERGVTRLAIGRKVGGALSLVSLAEIGIPVLAEYAAPRRWSFS